MTVNERLFDAGRLDEWDRAATNRDAEQMIKILRSVNLTVEEAESTVSAVLANPKKYGF